MANKRLIVLFSGNSLRLEGSEQVLEKIISQFNSAKIQGSPILYTPQLVINVPSVHAMMITNIRENPQEEYIRRLNNNLKEGDWWKEDDNNEEA